MDGRRTALDIWRSKLCGTGRFDSRSGRRICLPAARVRPGLGIPFRLDALIVGRPSSAACYCRRTCSVLWFFSFPAVGAPIYTFHIALPFHANHSTAFVFTWAQPLAVARSSCDDLHQLSRRAARRPGAGRIDDYKNCSVRAIIVLGFAWAHGSTANFQPILPASPGWGHFQRFFAALAAALWAYDGWEDINLVGSEVSHPSETFPGRSDRRRAFVAMIYIFFSAVCFYVLPFGRWQRRSTWRRTSSKASLGTARHYGSRLPWSFPRSGSLNSSIMSGARVDYAMARDGIFFRYAAAIHPRFRTPGNALIFQGCLAGLDGADRNIRRPDLPVYFCRLDFLWPRCRGHVPHASHRAGSTAPVSNLGISCSARSIRSRSACADNQHLD